MRSIMKRLRHRGAQARELVRGAVVTGN